MPFHPNFDAVTRVDADGELKIEGNSQLPKERILRTVVAVEHKGKVGHTIVTGVDPGTGQWSAGIPLDAYSPAPAVGDFVFAFGSEVRKEPLATITWSQVIKVGQ